MSEEQTDDERRAAGLSPATSSPGQRAPKFVGPRAVNVSFWLWVVGVVVLVLSQAFLLLIKGQVVDIYVKQNQDPKITREQWESAISVLLWVVLIGAVVFGALIALFAYKMREGTRSARTVVTVLAIVTTLFYFILFYINFPTNIFSVFAILLFVIAVVLLYLPSVQPYFPKVGRKLR
ncbi:MAG: hypothetical protein JWQ81_5611 [Amycolatopsis sp.]|uniref:hypothetical protein n=1 Tax=Amycolatopsis sp. TaxID=37632 RepID=UPI0026298628|nr:hypothetical protein [Amycolatopsis sp.]MCU1684872.1 hypothetical protein [Amycolatopsis sp.]